MTEPRVGFNAPIPESILTPDRVSTRIGEVEFFDGFPTADTAKRVFENLDFVGGSRRSSTGCRRLRWRRCGGAWPRAARRRHTDV